MKSTGITAVLAAMGIIGAGLLLGGCTSRSVSSGGADGQGDKKEIVYGKAAGPYTVLFEEGIVPILQEQGYQLTCYEFSDVLQSNTALNEGDIDVNVEQHRAYMENFNKSLGGKLSAISPVPTVPAGIFSQTHDTLSEIGNGGRIALPNDASNAARAYMLLQKAGWITLDPGVPPAEVGQADITENPYLLELIEMDSSNIPRVLDEFDYAVIPGSIVYNAGMEPSEVLLQEDILDHLILQVVVRTEDKEEEWVKAIAEAYRSEQFLNYLEENNDGLWYVPEELKK